MTVSSTLNRVSTNGNGVSTAFPVSFPFQSQSDLVVLSTVIATGVQTTKTITTDYTISGTPDALGNYSSGGAVNFLSAPDSTERITIYRDPARTQLLDLQDASSFPAESLEAQLDYATMLLQRVSDQIGRSLRQPDGDNANIAVLPSSVDRASHFLAFDSSGDPIAATTVTSPAVSSFMETVLDDTSAASAVVTLGSAFAIPTPTITCATPGDISMVYAVQWMTTWRFAGVVHVWAYIEFTPTYTTASGQIYIAGLTLSNLGTSIFPIGSAKVHAQTDAAAIGFVPTVSSGASPVIYFEMQKATALESLDITDFASGVAARIGVNLSYLTTP